MIEDFEKLIPEQLRRKSGSVFYSGKNAFSGTKPLYILGANPGGAPCQQINRTLQWHTNQVIREHPDNWSAYRDESWNGATPGTFRMQPRLLHMFDQIGRNPSEIPASNIVFKRSVAVADVPADEFRRLREECWVFHNKVINTLNIHTILCLGQDSGDFVREKLEVNENIAHFVENNDRHWVSYFYRNPATGMKVVVATHPSIADWTAVATDPTQLIKDAIDYPI